MYELTAGLLVLLLTALSLVFYSLRSSKCLRFTISFFFCFCACGMYFQWGAYADINKLLQKKKQQIIVEKALKQFNGPEDIIKRMEQHLSDKPDSAKGWYLLGKLYASQQQFKKSEMALNKSYHLEPSNLEVKIQLVEISYLANEQKMTKNTKKLLDEILVQWPDQLDALNFAAIDAFNQKNFALASKYWQRMLKLLPDGSKEKKAILSAIANAQTKQEGK